MRLRALTLAIGAIIPLVLATDTAAAAPPDLGSGNVSSVAPSIAGRGMDNPQTAADVVAYWTPERMRSAIPLDAPPAPAGKAQAQPRDRKPTGAPGKMEGAPPPESARPAAAGRAAVVPESPTVGKVFFFNPNTGDHHVCSGSALNSPKRRLILTAGHCVHGGAGGQWMQNWAFVPQYRFGVIPHGVWTASVLVSRTAWTQSGSFDEDMGIAIADDLNGRRLIDVVGGNGLAWNWSYYVVVTVLGYPAEPPFSGDVQISCYDSTYEAHFFAQEVRIACDMNGGSSGGPWLLGYDGPTGLGYANSVISHNHFFGGTLDGPYFDDDIKNLVDFSDAQA